MSEREARFEKMLTAILQNYEQTCEMMERLRKEDKTKTATYSQLMANKLTYQNILSMYRAYGLIEPQ